MEKRKKKNWGEVMWVVALTLLFLQIGTWTTNAWIARKTADMRANIEQLQKDLKNLKAIQENLESRLEYIQREQADAWCGDHPGECPVDGVDLQVAPAPAAAGVRGPI